MFNLDARSALRAVGHDSQSSFSRAVACVAFVTSMFIAGRALAQGIEPPPRENYGVQQPRPQPYSNGLLPDFALPGEGFAITRTVPDTRARSGPSDAPINLPREISDRLAACWQPPDVAENETMQVTVRLSFRRDGALIGAPATPFLRAPTDDQRRALRETLLAAIRACTPLRFTPSLGRAIAGRIFAIRFLVHHVASDQRT